jgi:DNA mismatch repair protein MutL
MPPRIQQLPALVINQIAAGEVIERPASVVKELLENAVDAGARRIEIDVEEGGSELIRVVDDGCGIAAAELPLAFASHATSKLASADDLFHIATFGFRGEALSSIGGVAHVLLQSRPHDSECGACVECHGAELGQVRPWNGAAGTRIEVRQLFFNTPVRRKFLRTSGTEMGHISEACTRLSLGHARQDDLPGLHLVLRHNGKLVHDVAASAGLLDRIDQFFGPDVSDKLYPLEGQAGHATLSGFIADPGCDRGNARMQYLFINGRWVRDRSLGHALQEAYRGLLMTGRYAVAFLFLDLPPEEVDVNVHPTKTEVRFRNSQALHHLVYTGVKARLRQANLVPRLQAPVEATSPATIVPSSPLPAPAPAEPGLPFRVVRSEIAVATPQPTQGANASRSAEQTSGTIVPGTPEKPPDNVLQDVARTAEALRGDAPWSEAPKVIQLYDAYLVVETDEGMLVIDQHALHERILFDQLRRRIAAGNLETQRLLIPEPIDLPAEAATRTLEHRDALAELGLGVEEFGGGTILLTRYPLVLGKRSPRSVLRAVVDHLMNQDRPPTREVLFDDLLSVMACHSAVRAGERLSAEEMAALIAQRHLADDHHHCPHGRPTALLFSRHDLERQFRRA